MNIRFFSRRQVNDHFVSIVLIVGDLLQYLIKCGSCAVTQLGISLDAIGPKRISGSRHKFETRLVRLAPVAGDLRGLLALLSSLANQLRVSTTKSVDPTHRPISRALSAMLLVEDIAVTLAS